MNFKPKNIFNYLGKYYVMVLLVMTMAVVFIAGVWIWYGYKNEQLERKIYLLR